MNDIGQRSAVTTGGSEFTGSPADWSWRYDALGQLEKAALCTTGDKGRNYQYDAIGNRVTSAAGNWNAALTAFTPSSTASYYGVLSNGTPSAPGANTLNQYAAIRGQFTADPVHDYDGNMTAGPVPGTNGNTPGVQAPANATDMVWDAENRLVSATVAGVTHTYAYDHLSRLVSRSVGVPPTSTTYYLYDGWNRIAGYDGAGVLQDTFTWGLDLSGSMQGAGGVGGLLSTRWASASGSPTYYPTFDGNGNISEYLTAAGTAAAHYEYDPFGTLTRLTGSNSTRFQYRFSTKPRDPATGLYYYGYRWYDPLTGRWPSRDPIGENGGVNLYGFVGNDGTRWVDVLGQKCSLAYTGPDKPTSVTKTYQGRKITTLLTISGGKLEADTDGTKFLDVVFTVTGTVANPEETNTSTATQTYYPQCVEVKGKRKCVVKCENITPSKLFGFKSNAVNGAWVSVANGIYIAQNGCGGESVNGRARGVSYFTDKHIITLDPNGVVFVSDQLEGGENAMATL